MSINFLVYIEDEFVVWGNDEIVLLKERVRGVIVAAKRSALINNKLLQYDFFLCRDGKFRHSYWRRSFSGHKATYRSKEHFWARHPQHAPEDLDEEFALRGGL